MNAYGWIKAKRIAAVILAWTGLMAGRAASGQAVASERESLSSNAWTLLSEEEDGMRNSPFWIYAPSIGQFVMGGGISPLPQRYDIEFFDLAKREWHNAYPEGAPYRQTTGATDAPHRGAPMPPFPVDKAGITRIRMDRNVAAYGSDTRLHDQYAYDTEANRIFVYFRDVTASFDPTSRQWTVLDTPTFNQSGSYSMMYGALAYDPVNREILSVGGTSDQDGGTPGVWALGADRTAWRKIGSGNDRDRERQAEAATLLRATDALANRLRNRFYLTETEAEKRADLAAEAQGLADRAERFSKRLAQQAAENDVRMMAAQQAARRAMALADLARTLETNPAQATLARVQQAQAQAWNLARALDSEPCGRGYSPMATDPKTGKIVLFGGTRKDRFLADTWVYDCATRTWEQRFPEHAPAPRAWHTLVWLPQSGKIALYGGTTRAKTPDPAEENNWRRFTPAQQIDYRERPGRVLKPMRDLWIYDATANTWTLLAEFEDGPARGYGAADDQDRLVVVDDRPGSRFRARRVWGMRVDPSAPGRTPAPGADDPAADATGLHPYHYDGARPPDPDGVQAFLKALPANRWQWMPEPPQGTPRRDWGTLPYDTDRHQILHWGGGHSSYKGTDMAHYSLLSASWSLGYASENPPTSSGFRAMANQTFNNRPHIPIHVWDASAYDPVSGKSVWHVRGGTWIYDPAVREWEYPPAPKPHPKATTLNISLASTPHGVVCWHDGRLHLFDAAAREWSELPLSGARLPRAYGDTSGLCYDAKRDCLWLAHRGGPMLRYDMRDGVLTEFDVRGAEGLFMRETVYAPEIDMLLAMTRVQVGDKVGNLAYDIEKEQWTGLVLPFEGKDQILSNVRYWNTTGSRSLHYDPKLGVAIFLFEWNRIGVLKLERTSLKTFDVKLRE